MVILAEDDLDVPEEKEFYKTPRMSLYDYGNNCSFRYRDFDEREDEVRYDYHFLGNAHVEIIREYPVVKGFNAQQDP